jgi:hypothetical protein
MTVLTFGSGFDTDWVNLTGEQDIKIKKGKVDYKFCKLINNTPFKPNFIAILKPTQVRIFECSGREDNKCLAYKAKVIKVLKGKYNKPYITFVNDGWEASGISFSNKVYFLSKEYKDEDINEKVHYSPEFFEYEARQDIIDCFKK